jgi:serine/threonine protein kinase
MSPEQVRGKAVDHRSDLFSVGLVLYEMLTGRRAFRAETAVETMMAVLRDDPPPLASTGRDLPPGLEEIVTHCLEKSPEERFQSARDLAFALHVLERDSSGVKLPPGGLRLGRPAARGILGLGPGPVDRRSSAAQSERRSGKRVLQRTA